MKTKLCSAVLLAALTGGAMAQDNKWIKAASSDVQTYFIKQGSASFYENKNGDLIIKAVFLTKDKTTEQVTISQKYVTWDSCKIEYGILFTTQINGDYSFENPFAFSANSVSSQMAEGLCVIGNKILEYKAEQNKKNQSKSINSL